MTLLAVLLSGCGGGLGPGQVPDATAVMAQGLSPVGDPIGPMPTDPAYGPTDPVFVSIQIDGAPTEGIIEASWIYRNQVVSQGWTDLSQVNYGVLFSTGDTNVGFHFAPAAPWPVGVGYRVDTTFNGAPLTSTAYRVKAPDGALPSKIRGTPKLADWVKGDHQCVNPRDLYRRNEQIHICGRADFGIGSWMEVQWVVGGAVQPECTQTATIEQNLEDVGFSFTCLPYRGWPPGTHEVLVVLDGQVNRYVFYVE